ncbi:MAG: hypothetical protein HKO05_08390 [Erythrobacter sp.]|jgi:hypothetical protein|nr:hypothetical protein [Erythrobacter sp.]
MLIQLAAISAIGYFGYRYYDKRRGQGHAAFDAKQAQDGTNAVRDAGPGAMRDKPVMDWDKTDEESDESFPASDPPANY